jgi:membrane-associated phospholipid phosphatase
MSKFVQQWQPLVAFSIKPGFHRQMAFACLALLIVSFAGCSLTSIRPLNPLGLAIGIAVVLGAWLPVPLYWNEKGKMNLRDAALTIPWALLITAFIRFPVAIAARLSAGISLQDANLARWDRSLGVSVPGIVEWASHHWLGVLANKSYPFLDALLVISFLLAALTGKVKHAQQFLIANLVAFAIGIPLSALVPAIGPWYAYHLPATPAQADCQTIALLIRHPGAYVLPPDVLICFPSFHVIWAIFFACALWGFRLLRVPVAILSGLIVVSTLTTGWHYFSDVVAGILVAAVAIAVAKALNRQTTA